MRFKRWWYKRGHRPRPGSPLYSPTLALHYAVMGRLACAFREGMERAERDAEEIARAVRDAPWPHPHHRCPFCGPTMGMWDNQSGSFLCATCKDSLVETDYVAIRDCADCVPPHQV